ncbi:hypothetical protein QZH41_006381 [Actinostola sp. cb2023]|nr:hypothetical protein QZH41_006381 [Actinostola sp. cb2023]
MTRKEKGRLYRQSLSTASQSKIPRKQHENEGTCPKPPTIHDDSSDDGTLEEEAVKADMVQPKHGVKMDTPPTTASKRKCNRQKTMTRKEKGRLYRQSLSTASQSKIPRKQHENEGTCPKPPTIHDDSSDDGTLEEEAVKADMVQPKHGVKMGNQVNAATILSSEDDVSSDDEELEDEGVLKDIKRRDDNFIHPRRIIAYTQFPDVDDTLSVYSTSNTIDGPITNALKVNRLPPYSTLEAAAEEFRRNNDSAFFIQFKSFGTFDRQGIRHLQRFHRLKQLRKEVEFEEKWLENAFENLGSNLKDAVTGALLDSQYEVNAVNPLPTKEHYVGLSRSYSQYEVNVVNPLPTKEHYADIYNLFLSTIFCHYCVISLVCLAPIATLQSNEKSTLVFLKVINKCHDVNDFGLTSLPCCGRMVHEDCFETYIYEKVTLNSPCCGVPLYPVGDDQQIPPGALEQGHIKFQFTTLGTVSVSACLIPPTPPNTPFV